MAKISDEKLSDLVSRAAVLANAHEYAAAKRLLLQVPPSQILRATQQFNLLHL